MTSTEIVDGRTIEEFRTHHGRVGGDFAGSPLLLLRTVDARSGEPRIDPMRYLAEGERYLVFASTAGSDRNPDWYWNLRAHPDVRIEVGDQLIAAHATELAGAEREESYRLQASRYPGLAAYQQQTTRVIPVVALSRRSSARTATHASPPAE